MEEGHFLLQHILFTRNRMTFPQKKAAFTSRLWLLPPPSLRLFSSYGTIGPFIILSYQLLTHAWWPCGAIETTPSTFLSGLIKENNCAIRVRESGVKRGALTAPGSTRLSSAQQRESETVGTGPRDGNSQQ